MQLATINDSPEPPSDGRAEPRSNIYVAAKIASAEACGPVCIRNLSPCGALVEGAALPRQGSRVRVSRGSLTATGTVAWRNGQRAGIRFDSAVAVSAWLPRGSRTAQQKIDDAVRAYKNGAPPSPHVVASASDAAPDLASALRELEQKLRAVAEEFAGDVLICERHLAAIQVIDIATARLATLAAAVD